MASNKTLTEPMLIPRGEGGYSLCGGWYICAAVLTPFFRFGRIEHDLFGVLFLIRQQQSYLLGYKNYQFLQKSIFLAPNSIFSSIFWGPIFSGQRHTPISFQAEYPPPPPPPGWSSSLLSFYRKYFLIWLMSGLCCINNFFKVISGARIGVWSPQFIWWIFEKLPAPNKSESWHHWSRDVQSREYVRLTTHWTPLKWLVLNPCCAECILGNIKTLIARFMGPTWGPSGADRTQVGPMLAPWTSLSGNISAFSTISWNWDYAGRWNLSF